MICDDYLTRLCKMASRGGGRAAESLWTALGGGTALQAALLQGACRGRLRAGYPASLGSLVTLTVPPTPGVLVSAVRLSIHVPLDACQVRACMGGEWREVPAGDWTLVLPSGGREITLRFTGPDLTAFPDPYLLWMETPLLNLPLAETVETLRQGA